MAEGLFTLPKKSETNLFQLSPINKFFYEAFTVVFCVIPIVSSLLVSCYLYDLTKRKRKLTIGAVTSGKNEHKVLSHESCEWCNYLTTGNFLRIYLCYNSLDILQFVAISSNQFSQNSYDCVSSRKKLRKHKMHFLAGQTWNVILNKVGVGSRGVCYICWFWTQWEMTCATSCKACFFR